MPHKTIFILGVPVDEVTEQDVLAFADSRISERRPAQIATVNAEYVMLARRNPTFQKIIEAADLRTADGMGVVWAGRKRGLRLRKRVGGSDLIWSLSKLASDSGYSVFLLGGGPGVAERAADRLRLAFPRLQVAGTYGGSSEFSPDDEKIRMIQETSPDILFVAFGAPAQDMWISQAKEALSVPIIMGVGGSFDYLAGTARRAPVWMRNAGLDWLFRLLNQPWRWHRVLALPPFAVLAAVRSD